MVNEADYEAAIRSCAKSILALHWGERLINKIFGRNVQSHAAGLIIISHFTAMQGRGRRPTLAFIQKEIGHSRTLAAFISLLRLSGFLSIEIDPQDRRLRFLTPEEPLLAGLRSWMAQHMRCCEIMGYVEPGTTRRLENDRAFFEAVVANTAPLLDWAREMAKGSNSFAVLDRFDCGDRIALALIQRHYQTPVTARSSPHWFEFSAGPLPQHWAFPIPTSATS
ncbi:hypothetical protein FHS85_001007 [Rhodoligotrophos appendicifer]|uniref:hypothetical protein n=1 Tax=Rhodoligotrophos appendicifer TaxID=987056 RepID=UPI00117D768A|nr:hypothetical protein [Rhodoligotrophos appendicifer]